LFVNLEVPTHRNTIMIDSNVVNRVVGDRNAGRIRGTAMRVDRFKIRNFMLMTGLTLGLTMLPAASRAFTQEDQRRFCTGDVFRLCSSEIPSVERITACMMRQHASLSEGCRRVFGRPTERSASAR
jgi:hypothetical protein